MRNTPPSMRRFTTSLMHLGRDVLGFSFLATFKVIQFILYFLSGICFYAFLRKLLFSKVVSLLGVALFVGSYPMLFAHFAPVYMWDDFWQYIALILAFHMILKDKPITAAIVFATGVIAREVTLVLYPVFVYALLTRLNWKNRSTIFAILFPLVCFAVNYALHFQPPSPGRFTVFRKNFINSPAAANVVFSFLVSFGVVWVGAIVALIADGAKLIMDPRRSFLVVGAIYAVPITVFIAFTMTLARETGHFFPPFVFLIPLVLYFVANHREMFIAFYSRFYWLPGLFLFFGSLWIGKKLSVFLFPAFDFRSGLEWTQLYFGIHISASILLLSPLIEKALRIAFRLKSLPLG